MSSFWHKIYIGTMSLIVVVCFLYLCSTGYSYYQLPSEERFYHPNHDWFKPSGVYGHGLGIIGTAMMFVGVVIYILRKRYNFMAKYIRLKYLLEFHIFLCVLGPILIVFHTAFKFGGIVSIAFWCMVAVVLSGVAGRFIYIQIPRSIEGRAYGLNELKMMRMELSRNLQEAGSFDAEDLNLVTETADALSAGKSSFLKAASMKRSILNKIKQGIYAENINKEKRNEIITAVRSELDLSAKIGRLQQMQELFKYWHVAHLPFALIMLIIVVVHVIVALAFGYKWIF